MRKIWAFESQEIFGRIFLSPFDKILSLFFWNLSQMNLRNEGKIYEISSAYENCAYETNVPRLVWGAQEQTRG